MKSELQIRYNVLVNHNFEKIAEAHPTIIQKA